MAELQIGTSETRPTGMKTCINCGRRLPYEAFTKRGRGFMYACKVCMGNDQTYPTHAMRLRARRKARADWNWKDRRKMRPAPTCPECEDFTGWTRATDYTVVDHVTADGSTSQSTTTESPDLWICNNGHTYNGVENLEDWK